MAEKIRILFLAADPTDQSRTRLDAEYEEIRREIEQGKLAHRFLLENRFSLQIRDMTRDVLRIRPHVIHFAGHGSTAGELVFEDPVARTKKASPEALEGIFNCFAGRVDCVVLNACYSEAQAEMIARYLGWAVGLPGVIGDAAAISFSVGFYQALSAGESYHDAFRLGCAQLQANDSGQVMPVLKKGPDPALGPLGPGHPQSLSSLLRGAALLGVAAVTIPALQSTARDPADGRSAPAIEIDRVPEPPAGAGNDRAGWRIGILAVALVDGHVTVRGEVTSEAWSGPDEAQARLTSLQVRVRLGDRSETTVIDAQRGTWSASLRPEVSPEPGQQLRIEAVLLGDRGGSELDRIVGELKVRESGATS